VNERVEKVKNLICENRSHQQVSVQSPKVKLGCPLVKPWVTFDVL